MQPPTPSTTESASDEDLEAALAIHARWRAQGDGAVPNAELARFLRDVQAASPLPRGIGVEEAAAVTVWVLAQRLGGAATKQLLAALPAPVRSLFEAFQVRTNGLAEPFDGCELHDRVAAMLGIEREDVEAIGRGVFRALRARLPTWEVDAVAMQLSDDLAADWLNVAPGEELPSGLVPTVPSIDVARRRRRS